jgi:AcrR family transcriptional regulator
MGKGEGRKGRPSGARDTAYEARRRALIDKLSARLSAVDAMHASYRELAESAGESVSTLQHYFGKRDDIITAILREARVAAEPYLAHMRDPQGPFEASVTEALRFTRLGFEQFGLGNLFAIGLSEGVRRSALGPIFVNEVLEPSIEALSQRLATHQARGDMIASVDPRAAAIGLLAPLILVFLHQHELLGQQSHPLDIDRFLDQHADTFVRGHRASGDSGAGSA